MSKSKRHKKNTRRYVPGRKTIKFGPHDAGVVFRGKTGEVKFFAPSVQEPTRMGGPTFWLNVLRWFFEAGPDGDERREVFTQEFIADMEERGLRREAQERIAKDFGDQEGDSDEVKAERLANAMDEIRDERSAAQEIPVEISDDPDGSTDDPDGSTDDPDGSTDAPDGITDAPDGGKED